MSARAGGVMSRDDYTRELDAATRPPPTQCPRCDGSAQCCDWSEVDIGVGIQTYDYSYACETCRIEFAFRIGGAIVFMGGETS